MSNTDSLLQQAINASLQQTEASKAVTTEVRQKMGLIDNEVVQAKAQIDSYIAGARGEYSITRQSRNQYGNLTGDNLDFFAKNPEFDIRVSLYRTILAGVDWDDRDAEEREILSAMGLSGVKNFQPSIRVMKMVWSGFDEDKHGRYTIYPNSKVSASTAVTVGSYAMLLSGDIRGAWLNGVKKNEWKCCGSNYRPTPGAYIQSHPDPYSSSGEVLFIWAGAVSGHVSIDSKKPKWGYFPSLYGDAPFDTKTGS